MSVYKTTSHLTQDGTEQTIKKQIGEWGYRGSPFIIHIIGQPGEHTHTLALHLELAMNIHNQKSLQHRRLQRHRIRSMYSSTNLQMVLPRRKFSI